MTPLFMTLEKGLKLMAIPDTTVHLDGHSILTYTYSIFKDTGNGNPLLERSKESTLHLECIQDPNYYGYITFEKPDKLFNYTPDGKKRLNGAEVEEVIEQLTSIRDNPAHWGQLKDI
jgi:hypothetical protein